MYISASGPTLCFDSVTAFHRSECFVTVLITFMCFRSASKVKGEALGYMGLVLNIEWIRSIRSFSEYHCHHTAIEGLHLQSKKDRMGKIVCQVLLVDIIKHNQSRLDGRKSLVAYQTNRSLFSAL